MDGGLRAVADLVPLLRDDRDVAHLVQERVGELVDLGGSGLAARKDAEVHADVDPWGLEILVSKRKSRFHNT